MIEPVYGIFVLDPWTKCAVALELKGEPTTDSTEFFFLNKDSLVLDLVTFS